MKRPDPLSVRDTLRGLRDELGAAGIESPEAEAERLLAHVLDVERSRLAIEAGNPLPAGAARALARLVGRRREGEPLQHLEGTTAFRDLVLRADRRALVPRPETEQLVELIARSLRGRDPASEGSGVRTVARPGARGATRGKAATAVDAALDIGTGGGAIALSLAAEGLARRVVALDVSADALAQARENRDMVGLDPGRVDFRLTPSDPFEALEAGERFDLMVSNPPYVRDDALADLPVEVGDHEPRAALAGGRDGLDLVRIIACRGHDYLESGARLFLEIGAEQGAAAGKLLAAGSAWRDVETSADLSGRDRFVTARRA